MVNKNNSSGASNRATPFQRTVSIALAAAAVFQMISVAFMKPRKK